MNKLNKKYIFLIILGLIITIFFILGTFRLNSSRGSGQVFEVSTNEKIYLNYKDSVVINNDLIVSFISRLNDSRCPFLKQCIWPGEVKIALDVRTKKNNEPEILILNSQTNPEVSFDNYEIKLIEVKPDKKYFDYIPEYKYQILIDVSEINILE